MRAVVLPAPGQVDVRECALPEVGPDDVLIRSRAVGICGSDVELFLGTRPPDFCRYPLVPGHEWAGEVVATGASVHDLAAGTKVVSEGFVYCGVCACCRQGRTNLCEAGYDEIGFTRAGGLAEYVAVPARLVHPLAAEASLAAAALLEPTAVVAQAYLAASPQPGSTVFVVGDGALGLLAAHLARHYTPALVVLVGAHDDRLALARRLGATHTINGRHTDATAVVADLTHGRGADLVVECGSRAEGVVQALRAARRGGTVVLAGIAGGASEVRIASDTFVLRQLSVHGVFGASAGAWSQAVRLFNARLLNLEPLITHHFAPAAYREALTTVMARQPGTLKVLLSDEESAAAMRKRGEQ